MLKYKRLALLSILTFAMFTLIYSINVAQDSSHNQLPQNEAVSSDGQHHEDVVSATDHAESGESHAEEKLNAGKIIMEHVADAHGWHLWGHTEIPLPIILYSSDRGMALFSSSRFEHGHKTYGGYMLQGQKVVAVNEMGEMDAHHATINEAVTANIFDISITKNVASIFICCGLMLLIFTNIAGAYTRKRKGLAPTGLQNAMEPIIMFVRDDLIKPSIGHKYEKYLPYLLTVFFFIWISKFVYVSYAFLKFIFYIFFINNFYVFKMF